MTLASARPNRRAQITTDVQVVPDAQNVPSAHNPPHHHDVPQQAGPARQEATAATARTRRRTLLLVLVLGVLSAIGPLATDLYLPALPQIASDLGTSEASVKLTLTSVMAGLALGQLVIGPLSDR